MWGCSLAALASATNLKKLAMVDMDYNNLSGNLSAACTLNARSQLQQLSLGSNAVNGSIPACLTSSSALVELRLDNNNLSGSIPTLAANSSLVYLTAGNQARPSSHWTHPAQLCGPASAACVTAVQCRGRLMVGVLSDPLRDLLTCQHAAGWRRAHQEHPCTEQGGGFDSAGPG